MVIETFWRLYEAYPAAIWVLGIMAVGLVGAAAIGCVLQSIGIYTGLFFIIFGTFAVAVLSGGMHIKIGLVCLSLLGIYGGVIYIVLFSFLGIRKRITEKKRRRAEKLRMLQFTLPDRDNHYVQARLHTALHVPNADLDEVVPISPLRLEYAMQLLAKIKAAPLTVAERLITEEIGKTLSLYRQKERWESIDAQCVNELLSQLLKTAAKYGV